jgi:pyruvate,water dikinase
VAPATDPSWTPLFTLASGVIVEVGGMLSHASTLARE